MPFKIFARENNTAEILIYEQIGAGWFVDGVTSKGFHAELEKFKDVEHLDIRINSPGGDVFEGYTIFNLLKNHKAEKHVYVDGIAASIASVIAMAGDKITMGEGSFIMIHEPWTWAAGNRFEFEKIKDQLAQISAELVTTYEKRTKLDRVEIEALVKAETYLNSDLAIEKGFADEVSGSAHQIAASALKLPWMAKAPEGVSKLAAELPQNVLPLNQQAAENPELESRKLAIAQKARSIKNEYLQLNAEYLRKE